VDNPLRRLGLLPENFGENRSYTKSEVLQLLKQAGIDEVVWVLSSRKLMRSDYPREFWLASAATRFMVRLTSPQRNVR